MRKAVLLILLMASSCSTAPRNRFFFGAGIGTGVGAIGGAALSPNDESRGLNAILFGLTGAIVGGVIGLFSKDDAEIPKTETELQKQEEALDTKEFVVPSNQELPAFVKERIQSAIVEEYVEEGSIGDDGTLREPHKVWRIKRPTELVNKPIKGNSK